MGVANFSGYSLETLGDIDTIHDENRLERIEIATRFTIRIPPIGDTPDAICFQCAIADSEREMERNAGHQILSS